MNNNTPNRVKIQLKKSTIGLNKNTKRTLVGLGLKRIGDSKELQFSNAVKGMINNVRHYIIYDFC